MLLTFRQITFQTTALDRPEIELFTDDGRDAEESLSARPEQQLVRWLISNEAARRVLCEEMMLSSEAFIGTEIQQPFYGPREGDIDLLMCDSPHDVVVFECKRVKVQVLDEGNDRVNKLEELGEGVQQTKKLHERFGFARTYFAVISAVAAANQTAINIPNRGISPESVPNWDTSTTTFRRIVEFPRREKLPDEVGIVFIELVQPSGRKFDEQGTIRICVHHKGMPRLQRNVETNQVRELMACRS